MRSREEAIKIQSALMLAGISQADIARKHGCSGSMVSLLIKGKGESGPLEATINEMIGYDLFERNGQGHAKEGQPAKEGGI